jgi:hypothetical protein
LYLNFMARVRPRATRVKCCKWKSSQKEKENEYKHNEHYCSPGERVA